jgi:hypothetical protein
MAKIAHLCVANLGNSLAITCDLRLDLHNFISSSTRPRIDQRLLKIIGEECSQRNPKVKVEYDGYIHQNTQNNLQQPHASFLTNAHGAIARHLKSRKPS